MIYDISLNEYPGEICLVLYHNTCNLHCPHCFNYIMPEDNKLTLFNVAKAIDETKDFITAVCLTGGEPLLCNQLDTIIKYIKDRGFKIKINTNGIDTYSNLLRSKNVDFINLSIKGDYQFYQRCGYKESKDELIHYLARINADILEYSLVFGGPFWDAKSSVKFIQNVLRKSLRFQLFEELPTYITIKQFKSGNCLDSRFNDWPMPKRDELVDIGKLFSHLTQKGIYLETYEFGREKIY